MKETNEGKKAFGCGIVCLSGLFVGRWVSKVVQTPASAGVAQSSAFFNLPPITSVKWPQPIYS